MHNRGALSPIAGFAMLLVLIAAGAVYLLMGSMGSDIPDPTRPTASPSEDNPPATEAESIANFKELDALRLALFARPEVARPGEVFTRGGPAFRRVQQALHELKRRGLRLHHPIYRTTNVEVVAESSSEVRLRQTVLLRTATTAARAKRTKFGRLRKQVVEWVLSAVGPRWLIHDGSVLEARFLR